MCDCSPGYFKIAKLTVPKLMEPHDPENDECYAAYCSAYYAAVYAFQQAIAANLDPACSECVEAIAGTNAMLALGLAEAQAQVAYYQCRSQNG